MLRPLSIVVSAVLFSVSVGAMAAAPGLDTEFSRGKARVAARAAQQPGSRPHARNVILFVGDGMGISTITAARILEGQLKGGMGEDNRLAFEDFPQSALVKTFTANQQTPDSAPTATAMVTGWKANDAALSVSPATPLNESDAAKVAPNILETILEQASARGLGTGVVTTTRVTHATPASNYAHTPYRDWEYNAQLPKGATIADIAAQLVARQKIGRGIDVVLAGGREAMMPNTAVDPEYTDKKGRRTDGRNLLDEWVAAQPQSGFVWNKKQFDAVDVSKVDHLLGLFEPSHMKYEADRAQDKGGEPSLAEMTTKAIQMLQKNRKGYYLMVEGGRIDHAHHAGNAYRALTDAIAFSDAVRAAAALTKDKDTLILVTADHSHVFAINGYPGRGNPILGLVKAPGTKELSRDINGKPYATLSYANGPGFGALEKGGDEAANRPVRAGRQVDLSEIDTEDEGYHQESLVALSSETHAGEDVALFARGPGADVVRGSIEQNEIYHIMRRALGF
ncbi:MAG: alkaline phosphatase [Proteobacteria bacterium]|nr:alkaline phosphatase [Pseudomonadota bacterium]